jgi:hypothetical protein
MKKPAAINLFECLLIFFTFNSCCEGGEFCEEAELYEEIKL